MLWGSCSSLVVRPDMSYNRIMHRDQVGDLSVEELEKIVKFFNDILENISKKKKNNEKF